MGFPPPWPPFSKGRSQPLQSLNPPSGGESPDLFEEWHREALARWDEAFERESGKRIDFTPRLHRCETPHELWKRALEETRSYRYAAVPAHPRFGRPCLRYMTPDGPMFLDDGLASIGRDDAEWAAAQQALLTAPRRDLDPITQLIAESTELCGELIDLRPGAIIEVKSPKCLQPYAPQPPRRTNRKGGR